MCKACRENHSKKQQEPPCEECDYSSPELLDGNASVLWLLQQAGGALSDGWGAPNVTAIKYIFELYEIPKQHQRVMFRKLIAYINASHKKAKEE
jgi:hypothetical protein